MTTQIKTEAPKAAKNTNLKSAVRKWLVRPIAYVTIFALASYGMRSLLQKVQDPYALAITLVSMAALVWLIFDSND